MAMNNYLCYPRVKELPPAGRNMICLDSSEKQARTAIYVGNVVGHYDLSLLLQGFELLNEVSKYNLILVCNEESFAKQQVTIDKYPWLEVHHTSGDGLDPLYRRASIALIIADIKYTYNTFAVSVKLFEYMSYGLPIVSSSGGAMKAIIDKYDIGITSDNTPRAYADAIIKIFEPERYQNYKENAIVALLSENLWEHRAQTIRDDLMSIK